MITDPVADLLTRVRNAQRAGHRAVRVRVSKLGEHVLQVMQGEGFVGGFQRRQDKKGKYEEFEVSLRYHKTGEPLIRRAERVSRPGQRVYRGHESFPRVDSGLGVSIVSTSQGVMSDREARRKNIGGEVLAVIG